MFWILSKIQAEALLSFEVEDLQELYKIKS